MNTHTFTEPFSQEEEDTPWSEQDDPAQPVWSLIDLIWNPDWREEA